MPVAPISIVVGLWVLIRDGSLGNGKVGESEVRSLYFHSLFGAVDKYVVVLFSEITGKNMGYKTVPKTTCEYVNVRSPFFVLFFQPPHSVASVRFVVHLCPPYNFNAHCPIYQSPPPPPLHHT